MHVLDCIRAGKNRTEVRYLYKHRRDRLHKKVEKTQSGEVCEEFAPGRTRSLKGKENCSQKKKLSGCSSIIWRGDNCCCIRGTTDSCVCVWGGDPLHVDVIFDFSCTHNVMHYILIDFT